MKIQAAAVIGAFVMAVPAAAAEPNRDFNDCLVGHVGIRTQACARALAQDGLSNADKANLMILRTVAAKGVNAIWADVNGALRLNPDSVCALLVRNRLNLAAGLRNEANQDRTRIRELLSSNGSDRRVGALEHFCVAIMMEGRQFNAGRINALTMAIAAAPELAPAYVERAYAHSETGNTSAAKIDLAKAQSLDPLLSRTFLVAGLVASRENREADAVALYNRAIELSPSYGLAHLNRGWSKFILGREQEALADYHRAAALIPDNPRVFGNRALAFEKSNMLDRALADWSHAIELSPSDEFARIRRAAVRVQLKDFPGAIQDYDQILMRNHSSVRALVGRGLAYEAIGFLDRAAADYRVALSLDPLDQLARNGLARVGSMPPRP